MDKIKDNLKKESSKLALHQYVVKEIICDPKEATDGIAVLLKHIIFLANNTTQRVAAHMSSNRNLSFKGIHASNNHKSDKWRQL